MFLCLICQLKIVLVRLDLIIQNILKTDWSQLFQIWAFCQNLTDGNLLNPAHVWPKSVTAMKYRSELNVWAPTRLETWWSILVFCQNKISRKRPLMILTHFWNQIRSELCSITEVFVLMGLLFSIRRLLALLVILSMSALIFKTANYGSK